MQIKKDIVRKQIINAASAEFCSKGYLDTSIRGIARRAAVSPANMYNYFRNKDELFHTVIGPLISDIEKGKNYFESPRAAEEICDLDDHIEMITFMIKYVNKNRKLFKLLAFNSFGSDYEKYVDDLTEWYTDLIGTFLPYMAKIMNIDEINVDRFVLHNITGIWIQFFREALMHDTPDEEFIKSAKEVMTFTFRGWEGLFKYKTKI